MENTKQKDSWVVEVEESLKGEIRADESPDGLIHKVPESFLSENTKVFYHPQVISLGPYHFEKKEKLDDEIELLKSDVAKKVHHEIIGALNSSENVGSPDLPEIPEEKEKKRYVKSESGLISVMESFKENEEKIKRNYARNFEFNGEVCAWMIARDACFVLEVLERFREDEEKSVSASIDRILSRKRYHPLLTEIVKDMLKMENQLPFWALKEIRPDIEDWFELALKNLSPIEVAIFRNWKIRGYKQESHILQLLHDHIVDRHHSLFLPDPCLRPRPSLGSTGLFILSLLCQSPFDCLSDFGCEFDWDYSLRLWQWIKRLVILLVYGIILLVLSPVLFIMFIIFVIQDYVSPKWEIREHVPTVEELKRLGVKFKRLKGLKKGISHIKFKESNSTLHLPQFKVDNRSEVILRNLIALEICSQEKEKPIARYVILMNDLINTSEDVGILRREDIITSKLGSDEEIARFWNSMVISTEVPRYEPIDNAVLSIEIHRKKWWKVLWAQFVMTHCSKPWFFLSLLAGLLLLVLTFVQVFCLFESCQIR